MENLTLTSEELGALKKSFALTFGLLVSIGIFVQWSSQDTLALDNLTSPISGALMATTFLFWAFYRWCWRWGPLPKLIGRPVVQGVWIGHLYSNFGQPAGAPPLQKNIVFVVRQTYLTLSIQSFTDTQIGESKVEAIIQNKRTDSTRPAYVFELKNEYSGAIRLVNGAGDLQLSDNNSMLRGNYWTSSPTHGTIELRKKSGQCDGINRFEDAVRRWPLGPLWRVTSS